MEELIIVCAFIFFALFACAYVSSHTIYSFPSIGSSSVYYGSRPIVQQPIVQQPIYVPSYNVTPTYPVHRNTTITTTTHTSSPPQPSYTPSYTPSSPTTHTSTGYSGTSRR